jgi:hypothetical protein
VAPLTATPLMALQRHQQALKLSVFTTEKVWKRMNTERTLLYILSQVLISVALYPCRAQMPTCHLWACKPLSHLLLQVRGLWPVTCCPLVFRLDTLERDLKGQHTVLQVRKSYTRCMLSSAGAPVVLASKACTHDAHAHALSYSRPFLTHTQVSQKQICHRLLANTQSQ